MQKNENKREQLLKDIAQVLFSINNRIFAYIKNNYFLDNPRRLFDIILDNYKTKYIRTIKLVFEPSIKNQSNVELTGFQEIEDTINRFPKDLKYALSFHNSIISIDVSDINDVKIDYSFKDNDGTEKNLVSISESGTISLSNCSQLEILEALSRISKPEDLTILEIIKNAIVIQNLGLLERVNEDFKTILSLDDYEDKSTEEERKKFYLNEAKKIMEEAKMDKDKSRNNTGKKIYIHEDMNLEGILSRIHGQSSITIDDIEGEESYTLNYNDIEFKRSKNDETNVIYTLSCGEAKIEYNCQQKNISYFVRENGNYYCVANVKHDGNISFPQYDVSTDGRPRLVKDADLPTENIRENILDTLKLTLPGNNGLASVATKALEDFDRIWLLNEEYERKTRTTVPSYPEGTGYPDGPGE